MKYLLLPLLVFSISTVHAGSITIGSLVAGQVEKVFVKTGQKVKKGQKLLEIDDRKWQAELKMATAKMRLSELAMQDARLELDQALDLFDRTVTSKRTLDAAQLAFDQAQQRFYAAEGKVEMVKSRQKYFHIVAPRKGKVKRIMKLTGSTVYKENTPMIELSF